MEELQAAHRKQLRDLQAQITQKKKVASKKTRKGVNDECARLEEDLKAKHEAQLAALTTGAEDSISDDAQRVSEENGTEEDNVPNSNVKDTSLEQETLKMSVTNEHETPEKMSQGKKPNRAKARLAKRAAQLEAIEAQAAEEAASLPDLRKKERTRMTEEFEKRGLQEKAVAANGHCMFSSIADQMRQLGLDLEPGSTKSGDDVNENEEELRNDDYKIVRRAAAEYIEANPDDFVPFLEEPLNDYVKKIRDTGEWGGQLELMALAKTYNLKIHVLQGEGRVEEIDASTGKLAGDAWLAYYRHGFGLGEHYNSLRMAPKKSTTSSYD